MKKIYLAHPISGKTQEEIISWYDETVETLKGMGYIVYHPMVGKGEFRNDTKNKEFQPEGYKSPVTANHAIFERDKWMVSSVDVVYVDLSSTTFASIGCTMELAWASMLGKHTIVVLPKENIHRHAFILEAADIIFETQEEAFEYLSKLSVNDI